MKTFWSLTFFILVTANFSYAQESYEVRTYSFLEANNQTMEYGLYIPTSYNEPESTPLVVALHGAGGDIHGMMEYGDMIGLAEKYGYLVVTPMGYNEISWYGAWGPGNSFVRNIEELRNIKFPDQPENLGYLGEQDVMNVIDIVIRGFNVDEDRVYLLGLSMGGAGVWHLGAKYTEIWAALVPIAPATSDQMNTNILNNIGNTPVLVIQGDADEIVPVSRTRGWIDAMERLEMNYRYLEVPGGTHGGAGRQSLEEAFEFISNKSRLED